MDEGRVKTEAQWIRGQFGVNVIGVPADVSKPADARFKGPLVLESYSANNPAPLTCTIPNTHPLQLLPNRSSPILLIIPHSNVTVKTRPRPIYYPSH
jgi:hypothetical protein